MVKERDRLRLLLDIKYKSASGKIAGKAGAAEHLGLKRTTLQNKIRKLSVSVLIIQLDCIARSRLIARIKSGVLPLLTVFFIDR